MSKTPKAKYSLDEREARLKQAMSSTAVVAPGRYAAGHNLYLYVSKTGGKSWTYAWQAGVNSKGSRVQREIGLGSYTGNGRAVAVSRKEAMAKAAKIAEMIDKGLDPRAKRTVIDATTFGEVCLKLLDSRANLKGDATRKAWIAQLSKNYAAKLWNRRIAEITPLDCAAVLQPVWHEYKAEPLQERMAAVFAYGVEIEVLPEDHRNPARLTKMLALLGERKQLEAESHAAIELTKLPAVIRAFEARAEVQVAMACILTTLTAVRTSITLGARHDEIEFLADGTGRWRLTKERMKAPRDHVVPLSTQAVAAIKSIVPLPGNPFVFHNAAAKDGHIVKGSMDELFCDKMGYRGVATMHGMRAAFETWAGGMGFNQKAIDMVMAHAQKGKKSKVKAAYDRNEMLEYRAAMLQAWADFVTGKAIDADNVVSLAERRQQAVSLKVVVAAAA